VPRLQDEIHQTKPFASLEEEVYLELQVTADRLLAEVTRELKALGLTPSQYNVLRILRGAGPGGITCKQIGGRMIHQDPDVTRLLDRLVAQGHAVRDRSERDRRVVVTRLTEQGRDLLRRADPRVAAVQRTQLGPLGPVRLRRLASLLEAVRDTTR
jgi:DNA-binding MarR family transcriptional regulator